MKITDEEKMMILGLYHTGKSMTEICAKSHRSDDCVRGVLKSFGVKVPRVYTRITPEIEEKAKSLRDAGQSFRAIAIQLGIGISTARRICTGIQELEESCQEQLCLTENEDLIPESGSGGSGVTSGTAVQLAGGLDPILEGLYIMRDGLNAVIENLQKLQWGAL